MTTATGLQRRLGYAAPTKVLAAALHDLFPGRIAVVSSFGAESAVLLHLVAAIDRATPVLFIDTGRHFLETLHYRDRLTAHLGLSDVRSVGPTAEEIARLDGDATRAIWDPDGCCAFRKTQPLKRALAGFDAWITGRKRFQAATRLDLPVFEADPPHIKINPLASWSTADRGKITDLTGLDQPYEAPEEPTLVLHTAEQTAEEAADRVVGLVLERT